MATKFSNNSFISQMSNKNINHSALRVMLVMLLTLGIGNAWGTSTTYYAKLTANVATGSGKVYVAASGSTGSFATTSNSTQSNSSTGSSANVSFQIGAQADNGYYFVNWTGNNKPSTATSNPGTVTISSNNSTSPGVAGTVSANFAEITINNSAAITVNTEDNLPTSEANIGSIVFTTKGDNLADFKATPDVTKTAGFGTFTQTGFSVATNGNATVDYKFVGTGRYGGTDDPASRTRSNSATYTITSLPGNNSGTCTVTFKFPDIIIGDGSFDHMTTINTVPKSATATFPVQWADDAEDFSASFGSETGGGVWTVDDVTYTATDARSGTISIDYTFNPNGAVGNHSAVLTLSANANAGGASKTLTLTAESEKLADNDASIGDTEYETLAEAITAANGMNTNPTVKILRNVEGLTSTLEITKPMTIDLNSFTVSGTLTSSVNKLFYLNTATAVLTINDSRNGGKISATGDAAAALTAVLVDKGSLVLTKGDIEIENTNTGASAAAKAAKIAAGARFGQTGGNLVATTAGTGAYGLEVTTNPADVNMVGVTGGTITATAAATAVGVNCLSSSATASGDPTATNVALSGVMVNATSTATDAYAVQSAAGVILGINSGTYNATAATTTAYTVNTSGYTAIVNGTFNATAGTLTARAINVAAGIAAVRNGSFSATAQTEKAHTAYVESGAKLLTYGGTFHGKLENAAANQYATGADVLGTLEAQGGTFIGEVAKTGLAVAQTNFAVGVLANTGSNVTMANATLRGLTDNTYVNGAYALYTSTVNPVSLTNCTLDATSTDQYAYGVRLEGGATPLTMNNCTATVTAATTDAYGLHQNNATSTIDVTGSTFNVTSNGTRAYGAYVNDGTSFTATDCDFTVRTLQSTAGAAAESYLHGIFVAAGKQANLTGCTFNVSGHATYSTNAYGIYISGSVNVENTDVTVSSVKSGYAIYNDGSTTAINIYSGKFSATTAESNATAAAAKQQLYGGYYVHNTNLAKYLPAGYMVETLTAGTEFSEGYKYHVRPTTIVPDPVCKIGSTGYATLEEALEFVNKNSGTEYTILMTADYTLPAGDYTLPAKATLLVPKKDQTSLEAHPTRVAKSTAWAAPTCNRKLTFAANANLVVWGKVQTGGVQAAVNQMPGHNGVPRDTYGHIVLNAGSTMILESGSHLYSWGYITGAGSIDAKRGSTVHENLQIRDWRGGTCTSNMNGNGNKVFPLNQYSIQNIEAAITFHPGSAEKCDGTVNARAGLFDGTMKAYTFEDVNLIGITGSGSLFMMDNEDNSADTWVRKYYDTTNDMQVYELNSSANLGSLSLSLYGISFNSVSYVLPLTNNMHIHLLTGTMHITQDTEVLPGAIIEIDKEATAYVDKNKSLYIFDADEWDKFGTGTSYFYLLAYSATLGKAPTARSESTKPADAALNLHGKLEVEGKLYTTSSGANICSTNEDAGRVHFVNAASSTTTTIYVANNTGPTYNAKTADPARLKNGDGTYEPTSGTVAGKTWIYTDDKWKCWEVDGCFIRDAQNNPYAHPADYVRLTSDEPDANHLYKAYASDRYFIWDASCQWWEIEPTLIAGGEYKAIKADHNGKYNYYEYDSSNGYWKIKTVTIIWKNGSTTLGTYSNVGYKTHPKYLEASPSKASTATDYYTWLGWTKGSENGEFFAKDAELPVATENTTYYAYFKADKFTFRATFNNYDGSLLETKLVAVGETPVYEGETPVKPATTSKEYTFTGWSPALAAISNAPVTYTAQFSEKTREYTVQWVNYNGTVLKEEKVAYGNTPTAPVKPTRPNDEFYTYTFNTWSPAITSVSGNQTYTATYNYKATVTKYTVTFKNGSETIYTQSLPNDETPAFGGTTPTKTPTAQYTYTFDGWSTSDGGAVAYAPAAALPDVSGADVTYYAHFSTTTNTYTIRWKSEDGKILYETDPTVSYGSTPSYDGDEPNKARLGETQYAHDGWSSSIGGDKNDPLPTVSGNTTYYAHFIEAYDITWVNEDGSVTLETDNAVPDGSATVYNGATPTKDATAQYTFTFDGWAIVPNGDKVYNNGATLPVSGLATYYAHFGSTIRSYDVTFDLKGHGDDIDSQVKDYGSWVDEPAAPEATGYTFSGWYKESSCTHEWSFASDVVTGATTLYAKWTPNTNTPYTVKHYKQKLDGTYQDSEPDSPFETENMTGTTDADVTPATKSYTGFTAPDAITAPVEANGTLVIGYYYTRNSHSLSWNWAGGSTSATVGDDYTAGGAVKYEAPLTYPANSTMTRTGYDFNGWSTSVATMPAEELTITATWTPKKYAITWKSEDGSSTLYTDATADYDSEPVYGGATPAKSQDADYTYTFDGWTTEANGGGTFYEAGATPTVSGDATYYAHFFRGTVIDIIDWTFEADKAATVTLNMNGYSSRKAPWHIGVSDNTDIDYVAGDRNADRTLTLDISSLNLTSGSTLTIIGKDADLAAEHTYTFRVPYVYTSNTTLTTLPDGENNTIFVHDGATLTIDGTVEVSSVYVNPQAKLVITENKQLTVLKRLVMRTTAWKAAELLDNGTLSFGSPATGQMYYTRQISDKTSYYQFSLPYASRIEDVFSSNSKSTPYGNWVLKRYDGASRAKHGEEGPEGQGNWVSLSSTEDIQPYTGYEIWSNSAYYRELFFPVTYAKHSIDDDIEVAVLPHTGAAATQNIANAGWNYISTPFTFTYIADAPPTITISELTEDNATYWQHVVDPSHPLPTARPFLYQAGEEGKLVFGETITFKSKGSAAAPAAANGRIAESQPTSLQWIRLTAKAIETQLSDETNILISSRYTAAYELGCDVQKMLSNGNRPQVYTSLACGILTTTAVPDDITAIPLGLYTPEAGLYTFTVDANRWQDRIDHVWLLDTESGTTHDLLFSPYQYAAERKMTTSRFVLMPVMKAESSTESGNGSEVTTDVEDSGNTDIHVNVNGGQISVSGLTAGMPVILYDATGRLIAKHNVQQSREVSINVSAAGVYLLRYGNDTRRVVIGK